MTKANGIHGHEGEGVTQATYSKNNGAKTMEMDHK